MNEKLNALQDTLDDETVDTFEEVVSGKVYTMFGPLPEMKGSTVVITATYGSYTDSIIIHLH